MFKFFPEPSNNIPLLEPAAMANLVPWFLQPDVRPPCPSGCLYSVPDVLEIVKSVVDFIPLLGVKLERPAEPIVNSESVTVKPLGLLLNIIFGLQKLSFQTEFFHVVLLKLHY